MSRPNISMAITEDRVVYRGLIGTPTTKRIGALCVYVALDSEFDLRIDAQPLRRTRFAAVWPNVPHQIASSDKVIGALLIEPEFLDKSALADVENMVDNDAAVRRRLASAFQRSGGFEHFKGRSSQMVDEILFGRPLKNRELESRIAMAVGQIRANPAEQYFAVACAKLSGLSFSRFVHLFKEEIGVTFRGYVAWKRARALLQHVLGSANLTTLAMLTGYPDSTYFSHSIRRIYGLTPREIIAGCRKMDLVAVEPSDHGIPGGRAQLCANTDRLWESSRNP